MKTAKALSGRMKMFLNDLEKMHMDKSQKSQVKATLQEYEQYIKQKL